MVKLETLKKEVQKEKKKMFFKFLLSNLIIVLIISVSLSTSTVTEREKDLLSYNKELLTERDSLKNLISNELLLLKENENKMIRKSLSLSMDTTYIDKNLSINEMYLYTQNKLSQSNTINEVLNKRLDSLFSIPVGTPITLADMTSQSGGFGWRKHPILKRILFHDGVDISAYKGTEVFVTANGVIEKVITSKKGYGNRIIVDHGNGYKTVYAHLSKFNAYVGQKVKQNDLIGYVGSTGLSTGPHLHYEILLKNRPVNPEKYFYYENTLAKK